MKATLHWVSAAHAVPVEVRLYDRLFSVEDPERGSDRQALLGLPESRVARGDARLQGGTEPARPPRCRSAFQFERLGYFCVDPDSQPGALVFNRTVSLRDAWARIEQR